MDNLILIEADCFNGITKESETSAPIYEFKEFYELLPILKQGEVIACYITSEQYTILNDEYGIH